MKDKSKLIKILIPLIAAVVVFESILLVTNLNKSKVNIEDMNKDVIEEAIEKPVMDFVFSTDLETKEMKVGKSYEISLNLLPKEDKKVDAIEVYIKYGAEGLVVDNLVSNKKLPKATLSEVDEKVGVIKNIILIDEVEGLELKTGELLPVLTFEVTPGSEGIFKFELASSNENGKAVSIVVENGEAKELPWMANELEINVIN